MLELVASPAYKDLLDALGKLAEWSEQAGPGSLPSGPPPEDLVRQFNEALAGTPMEAAQRVDATGPTENAARPPEPAVPENTPAKVIAESDLFPAGRESVRPANEGAAPQERLSAEPLRDAGAVTEAQEGALGRRPVSAEHADAISAEWQEETPGRRPVAPQDTVPQESLSTGQRREAGVMTEAQGVNLDRGLDALGQAAETRREEFLESAYKLSQLLSRPAAEISPLDMLQAQRLMGTLKVQSESGRKVSEGVSDTLEQLLEQQG